jgi:hypothetical protein
MPIRYCGINGCTQRGVGICWEGGEWLCDLHIRRCRHDPDHMLCENEFAEHERACRPLCTIWRIHIKPTAKEGVDPRAFCLENSILGVGWLVEAKTKPDWKTYLELASKQYPKGGGWHSALNAIKKMRVNDLCWTRSRGNVYYLGRVTTPDWRYCDTPESRAADVINVRDCDWMKVGLVDAVPGKVIACFRPTRSLQKIDSLSVRMYSQYLYNRKHPNHYTLGTIVVPDLFEFLDSDDLEDIVSLYLQAERHFLFISSSRQSDTGTYEFVLRHRDTHERAVVQVKHGNVDLSIKKYSRFPDKFFLFTSGGRYIGHANPRVECLTRDVIANFIALNRNLLPPRTITKMCMFDELTAS